MKSKTAPKKYPINVADVRTRARVNKKAAELTLRFNRMFTQQDAITYLLDADDDRSNPATAPATTEVTK